VIDRRLAAQGSFPSFPRATPVGRAVYFRLLASYTVSYPRYLSTSLGARRVAGQEGQTLINPDAREAIVAFVDSIVPAGCGSVWLAGSRVRGDNHLVVCTDNARGLLPAGGNLYVAANGRGQGIQGPY